MGGQKFWRDWVVITLALALSWVVLFMLNPTLHIHQSDFPWISAVFLPAGLRIYGVMLFRERAIPGLFLGNVIVTILKSQQLPTHLQLDPLAAGIISSLTPFVSLLLFEKFCHENVDVLERKIRAGSFLKFIGIYAIVNGLAGCAYFRYNMGLQEIEYHDVIEMALGDFLGAIIFLYIVYLFRAPIKKLSK